MPIVTTGLPSGREALRPVLRTTITVRYPAELGKIGLRGDQGPLSWTKTTWPDEFSDSDHIFHLALEEGHILEFKAVRNEREWSCERNYTILAGDSVTVEPYFDFTVLTIEDSVRKLHSIELGRTLTFQVLLPRATTSIIKNIILFCMHRMDMRSSRPVPIPWTEPIGRWIARSISSTSSAPSKS